MSIRGAEATPAADLDAIESRGAGFVASLGRVFAILGRHELAPWRWSMAVAFGLTLIAKLLSVISPVFFGEAVNRLADGKEAAGLMTAALAAWVATRLLASTLPYARDALFAPISQAAQRLVAVDAFAKAQHLSLRFHQTRRTGALQRVIERGAGALDTLIRFLGFNIVPTVVELAIASAVLAVLYGAGAAASALLTVAAYAAFTYWVTRRRVIQQRRLNEADTELRARAVDSLTNFETVKAFAAEDRETDRYGRSFSVYGERAVDVSRSLAFLNAGQEGIMSAGLSLAVGLAAYATLESDPPRPGDLAAVVLIMMNLFRPLNILGFAFREIRQGAVDLEKLFGLMAMRPEIEDAPGAAAARISGGQIRFENVRFSHPGRRDGLVDISFFAGPGERIGIAGPSGAGKSTVFRLLMRLYEADAGRICVDGQDIRLVTQASLREAIGLVPQDVVLFNATLRDNIVYGRPDAAEEDIAAALELSQLSAFVRSLPAGLETRVGERGVKLSGGERQRVGIARAVLKNPAILLFDEATSQLDSATEAEVQGALARAMAGRTCLIIAHRLSTLADADRIYVIENGRIVEQGRHSDLVAAGGAYEALWRRQSRET
jgi:ATP-binding cassette subfamily B protein